MAYVALKPCCFADRRFKIGETIPGELIHPASAANLIKMNIISANTDGIPQPTIAPQPAAAVETMTVNFHAKEGDLPLELTQAGLQAAFDVLTANATEAEKIIGQMTDGDALIFLDLTDTRKTIKEAAKNRAQAINAEQEGQESVGEE